MYRICLLILCALSLMACSYEDRLNWATVFGNAANRIERGTTCTTSSYRVKGGYTSTTSCY